MLLVGYPNIIPYTKFEHFVCELCCGQTDRYTDKQSDKQTDSKILPCLPT